MQADGFKSANRLRTNLNKHLSDSPDKPLSEQIRPDGPTALRGSLAGMLGFFSERPEEPRAL